VKLWILLLGLLIVACVAAFGWQMLAADPGYVLIRLGNTRIETTFIFALVALLVAWGVLSAVLRVVRWPFRTWSHRTQRRGRERIAAGLTALAEGPAAALALRARFLIEQGKPDIALDLLTTAAKTPEGLAPSSRRLLVEAALLCGDHQTALDAVNALGRDGQLSAETYASLQARVLAATLSAASSGDQLNALWSGLTRAQRSTPEAIDAYARRAAEFGLILPALDELESALRRQWSERLIRAYGEIGEAEADTRLRRAEGWLAGQPNSPGLLLTLGRLCNHANVWGKARDYLERGLAIEPSAALWEALGECRLGQGDTNDATRCFRNALRFARDEPVESVAQSHAFMDTRASAVEQRSAHGVPLLAVSSGAPVRITRE
jgi:HemY protein